MYQHSHRFGELRLRHVFVMCPQRTVLTGSRKQIIFLLNLCTLCDTRSGLNVYNERHVLNEDTINVMCSVRRFGRKLLPQTVKSPSLNKTYTTAYNKAHSETRNTLKNLFLKNYRFGFMLSNLHLSKVVSFLNKKQISWSLLDQLLIFAG